MASPWKHPKTGIYHIRVGIPKRLRPAMPEPWTNKREYKRPLVDKSTGDKARSESDVKHLWAEYWEQWDSTKRVAESQLEGIAFRLPDRNLDIETYKQG